MADGMSRRLPGDGHVSPYQAGAVYGGRYGSTAGGGDTLECLAEKAWHAPGKSMGILSQNPSVFI